MKKFLYVFFGELPGIPLLALLAFLILQLCIGCGREPSPKKIAAFSCLQNRVQYGKFSEENSKEWCDCYHLGVCK